MNIIVFILFTNLIFLNGQRLLSYEEPEASTTINGATDSYICLSNDCKMVDHYKLKPDTKFTCKDLGLGISFQLIEKKNPEETAEPTVSLFDGFLMPIIKGYSENTIMHKNDYLKLPKSEFCRLFYW